MFLVSAAAQSSADYVVSIRSTVTFWIAVFGFLLSLFNLAVTVFANYKRVSFCVKAAYKISGYVLLSIQVTNKSRLGISLTGGEVDDLAGHKIAFGETSTVVFTYAHPDLSGKSVLRTDIFPIHIDPLYSVRIFMQTETWDPALPLACQLRFGSSRGWIRAKIDLPAACEDLQSLLRHLR